MSVKGTGALSFPLPVIHGADQPYGVAVLPLLVTDGYGGAYVGITLPVLRTSGTGTAPYSYADISLTKIVVSSIGYVGVLGNTPRLKLPIPIVTGTTPVSGIGAIRIPVLRVSTIPPGLGLGMVIIPTPFASGFGRPFSIDDTYRGIVMNISNQAISTYTAFPFNSIAKFRDRYYGASSDGLYLLDGHMNGVLAIQSRIKTGPLDFGDGFLKRLREVWLTYRSDGKIEVTFSVDEAEHTDLYSYETQFIDNDIHEERIKAPRGLKGRYYTITLSNVAGADFDLEQISILVDSLRKRVR